MLVHCSVTGTWTDGRRLMDAVDEAIERANNNAPAG